jgi:hypothetical protein
MACARLGLDLGQQARHLGLVRHGALRVRQRAKSRKLDALEIHQVELHLLRRVACGERDEPAV